jgi:glycosyltransferase involved in cell wall biosynthesis
MSPTSWHLITGEYGPALGGVAGYSQGIARALAARGEEVHVWAPPRGGQLARDPEVQLHPLEGGFDLAAFHTISRALASIRSPKRILLQYVPQAFGKKGMNVALPLWLVSLRDAQLWVMFHEVVVPWGGWRVNVLSAVTRTMASIIVSRADRVFVSVPMWESVLHSLAPWRRGVTWLPVPTNVPMAATDSSVAAVRRSVLPEGGAGKIIGHFGSHGPLVTPLLKRALVESLRADSNRVGLLIGRGSEALARDIDGGPSVRGRVRATGALPDTELAAHLRACDVMLQPFPDGVSGRRTSVMAGLALGVPVATNEGPLTEPLWRQSEAVELARSPEDMPAAVAAVLADPERAARLVLRGRSTYQTHFSLERTIDILCGRNEAI